MADKNHLIILLIIFLPIFSQCSIFSESGPVSENHFEFLIFTEDDVRTEHAKIGSILDDLWLRGVVSLNKNSSKNIGIGIISNRVIIADNGLNILNYINLPYRENSRSVWYYINQNKGVINLDQAVSDSMITNIEIERLTFKESEPHSFKKVLDLEIEGPEDNFLTKPQGLTFRNEFDASKLYSHSIKYQLQRDSLGQRLFLTPYSFSFTEFEYSVSLNQFSLQNKLTNIPLMEVPLFRFHGLLGDRFAFITGHDRRIYFFDNKLKKWDALSEIPLSHYVSENWYNTYSDSSFIFVSNKSLNSFNPYTQKTAKLHEFEQSIQNGVVQYDKETGRVLLNYFFDEVDGNLFTNRFTTKCFTFDVRENMKKKEIFSSSFTKDNYLPVISNFIKINGSYYGIISKRNSL